ncbi:MAG: hypothetical protein TQ37_01770 [Candidatus Synechococcus spongiarum 15L]|uniref:Uncharacterized protein n=1 Tax=Candidatus Synechococcus spongiarum 15L TaxID=1608419 RepID=A0A0G8AXZ2_9SYNE|nr:MAG: hypothetical protein TQ37_01770 [Candidatus Synechococcus spongiarum 15L]
MPLFGVFRAFHEGGIRSMPVVRSPSAEWRQLLHRADHSGNCAGGVTVDPYYIAQLWCLWYLVNDFASKNN